jgi:molecular chaperone GrpE
VLDDLEALRERAEAAERKRDEYLDQLQRTRAEFENYQKRARRDLDEERRYAYLPLARELLPVLDNLQRALGSGRREGEQDSMVQGVALVETQLLNALRRFGVTPIEALGRPFDPMVHEAVAQEPRTDAPPGTVVGVLEPGYRLHERILRPARVVVAAPIP